MDRWALLATFTLGACATAAPTASRPASSHADASPSASLVADADVDADSGADANANANTGADAGPDADPYHQTPPALDIEPEEAEPILFPVTPPDAAARLSACPRVGPNDERVRCLIALLYKDDPAAASIAIDLYTRTGAVAGVEVDHVFEGGFRGRIHVVPALPVAANRHHLEWVAAALVDYDVFFAALGAAAPPSPPPRYRWRALALRFYRSLIKRTPAAYASGWSIAYNVVGSINTSADAVRETLFHEIFHLNDEFHDDWSKTELAAIYSAIIAKCHARTPCLAPYAPHTTIVVGGTYYAFQPGNDVREYAAELALRYYRETRAQMRRDKPIPAFKCGPPENARAWAAISKEFFAGVDLVPPCAP
jgi:hypothetical protein